MLVESNFGCVPEAVQSNLLAAFAIRLGASTFQVGILSAVVNMFIAASLMFAARLVGLMGGRKRMLLATMAVGALPWVFISLVPLLPEGARVWALIPIGGVAVALFVVADPVWGSWMSDLVPVHRRGRYLGLRMSMVSVTTMAVGLCGAFVLDLLHDAVLWGFVAAFSVAAAARLVSLAFYWRIVDPRPELKLQPGPMPWKMFYGLRSSLLGRYNIFLLWYHIGIGFGTPFFSVYLLRDLDLKYTVFVALNMVQFVTMALTLPWWGKVCDRRGNMFVLVVTGITNGLWPLVHLVSPNLWYLTTAYAIVGAVTAGWAIVLYNFVLEHSEEGARPSAVGYARSMMAAGLFIGAIIGGVIASRVPGIFGYSLLTMFAVSAVIRTASVFAVLQFVRGTSGRSFRASLVDLFRAAPAKPARQKTE